MIANVFIVTLGIPILKLNFNIKILMKFLNSKKEVKNQRRLNDLFRDFHKIDNDISEF